MKAVISGTFDREDPDGTIYIMSDSDFEEYGRLVDYHFLYVKEAHEKYHAGLDHSNAEWNRMRGELRALWEINVLAFVESRGTKIDDWVRL
jgi:hypothetical protein